LDTLVRQLHEHAGRFCREGLPATPDAGENPQPDGRLQGPLPPVDELSVQLDGQALAEYRQLGHWLAKASLLPFDRQLYAAFGDLMARFATEKTVYADLNRIIQSYIRQREIFNGLTGHNEGLSPGRIALMRDFPRWWLAQVKTGSV